MDTKFIKKNPFFADILTKNGFFISISISREGISMKISNNQANLNTGEIVKQNAINQATAGRQIRKHESVKDASNKPKNEAKEEPGLNEKQLLEAIEKTNKAIEGTSCSFRYSVHDVTKQIMVKVIDNETQEVIKEFPPEKILDMVAKMWEVAGILVDERR